jgi:hypothetical protein
MIKSKTRERGPNSTAVSHSADDSSPRQPEEKFIVEELNRVEKWQKRELESVPIATSSPLQ